MDFRVNKVKIPHWKEAFLIYSQTDLTVIQVLNQWPDL